MIKNLKKLNIRGCYQAKLNNLNDNRGFFCKNFNFKEFKNNKLHTKWNEDFFSLSNKNVLRGMHIQNPPYDQYKLIMCLTGSMIDVLLDLRKSSKTFKKYITVNLSSNICEFIYIPPGVAHGFLSLENNSIAYYKVSSIYSKFHDTGIHWNSFGYNWPIKNPIISIRDQKLDSLNEFKIKFL